MNELMHEKMMVVMTLSQKVGGSNESSLYERQWDHTRVV